MELNKRGPAPEGKDWFPADVTIRDTKTGEVRTYAKWETTHDGEGWSDFIWVDGNFACDCNRALFFEYAAGVKPEDIIGDKETHPCGDGRYRVESIKDARDGRELYSEKEDV